MSEPTRCLSAQDFEAPPDQRWFEDYVVGSVYEYGEIEVTQDQIIDFAVRYDPQRIHTDPEFSASGPFGGLIASGVQTMAVGMRLFVDHYVSRVAGLASPGIDELRWPRPVRPGDRLRGRATITAARPTRSDPRRGLVHTAWEVLNQDGEVVLSMKAMNFFATRPADADR